MAQVSSYNVANRTGALVRSDINDIYEAIKTCNSGVSDPSSPVKFMLYGDSTVGDDNLKIYDGAQFRTIGKVTEDNLGLLPKDGGTMTGVLQASAGSASAPAIHFGDSGTGLYKVSTNVLGISLNGTNQFTFNATKFESKSDINIEKTGSDAYLQIKTGTSNNAYLDFSTETTGVGDDFGLRLIRGGGTTGHSVIKHRSSDSNNGSLFLQNQNPTAGNIIFSLGGDATTTPETEPVERWKIEHSGSLTSNGNLSTNALTTAGACFNIQTTAFEGLSLTKNGTGWGTALFINRLSAAGTGNFVEFQYNNSNVGAISTNGSTTTYNPNSDYRLKQDISNIDDAITKIKALRPVLFRWKNNPDLGYDNGFIAHEVQETGHYNHIVTGVKDGTKKSYSDPGQDVPDYQGVDYSRFTPMLVAALQEAVAKIETLETKVAALEAS